MAAVGLLSRDSPSSEGRGIGGGVAAALPDFLARLEARVAGDAAALESLHQAEGAVRLLLTSKEAGAAWVAVKAAIDLCWPHVRKAFLTPGVIKSLVLGAR